jgi:hypothetical protein
MGVEQVRSVPPVYFSGFGFPFRMGTDGDDCSTGFSNMVLHNVPNRGSDTRTLRDILPQLTELITTGDRIA